MRLTHLALALLLPVTLTAQQAPAKGTVVLWPRDAASTGQLISALAAGERLSPVCVSPVRCSKSCREMARPWAMRVCSRNSERNMVV